MNASRTVTLVSAAIVCAGIAWRFATLDIQSYWLDEAYTVDLVRLPFIHMLRELPQTESTPPVFYILGWLWARVFGTGEVGLRSLSALLGTATIGVVYVLGLRLGGKIVAAIAAALVAVNPLLVWYSQEARSYALMALLTASSLVFLLRADERRRRVDYALWAVLASLALATHYFALYFVVGEVAWLLGRARGRSASSYLATMIVFLTGVALLPLVLYESQNPYAFSGESLVRRIAEIPKQFAIGFNGPHEYVLGLIGALLLLLALVAAARGRDRGDRSVLTPVAVVTATSILLPVATAIVGHDYVNTRNLIAGLVPLLVVAALGFSTNRATLAAAAALVLISLGTDLALAQNRAYQRPDYRGVVRALPPLDHNRLLVLAVHSRPILLYATGAHRLEGSTTTREIAFVSYTFWPRTPFRPPAGFHLVRSTVVQDMKLDLFESDQDAVVTAPRVGAGVEPVVQDEPVAVLLQSGSGD
jgi:4-amino-4-deoxy-L-arabinose transferase-like glycosyltransferase